MTLVRAARLLTRLTVRPLAVSTVRNVDPNRPGSFLNGEDGRKTERVNTIGPVAAEEKYVSHEYYNHDKLSFYDALADCNHMRADVPDAQFKDYEKHIKN